MSTRQIMLIIVNSQVRSERIVTVSVICKEYLTAKTLCLSN